MMLVPGFSGSLPQVATATGDGSATAGETHAEVAEVQARAPIAVEPSFDVASIVMAHECAKISFTC
jgi:hypothetical protein